jgi:condensin complex subunit 3
MPPKSKPRAEPENLSSFVPRIFEQAQTSTANHQKNYVALFKAHSEAATRVEDVNNGKSMKLVGEREFEDVMLDMIARILPLKKGVTVADRIVRFIGGYVRFINEKGMLQNLQRTTSAQIGTLASEENHDEDEDTTASRFIARLLTYLLRGFVAKDKSVRFRCVYLVAEMVSHLGEIECAHVYRFWVLLRAHFFAISEEVYTRLRSALLERVTDKEPPVRIQAVIALSKLCGSEDPSDVEEGEQTAVELLLEVLSSDSAAYALLFDRFRYSMLNITYPVRFRGQL